MKRAIVGVLASALLAGCCAPPKAVLPAGEDADRLEAAIARRGQSDFPTEPTPPTGKGMSLLGDCLTTGAKIGETCVLLSVMVVWACAKGDHPDDGNFGDALGRIWSND